MARFNKRPYIVSVRFSEEEYNWLKKLREFFHMTPSQLLRKALADFWYMNRDITK